MNWILKDNKILQFIKMKENNFSENKINLRVYGVSACKFKFMKREEIKNMYFVLQQNIVSFKYSNKIQIICCTL